jgi:large subunit ribosomal protein L33
MDIWAGGGTSDACHHPPGLSQGPLAATRPRPLHWLLIEVIVYAARVFGDLLMAKSKKKIETVFLVCEETGDYNYTLRRKTGGEKLKLKKYSPRLRKHTLHTEKKK